MGEKKVLSTKEVPPINLDNDRDKIEMDCIKFMLKNHFPLEDIQHLTKRSLEEIKRIGEMTD